MGGDNIKVFDTQEALSSGVADFIVKLAAEAIQSKGRFVISLSGGSTPSMLFKLLATDTYKTKIAWDRTFVWWGDERCVLLDNERNNAHVAKTLLLDHVDIPAANVYRIPSDLAPEKAAQIYEDTMRTFFKGTEPKFDLILLGLGDNGHTASLFPGTDVVHETNRWVKEVYVDEQKEYRITMTAPVINQGLNVAFLVAGAGKAEVVHIILYDAYDPDKYPAQLIKPGLGEQLYWYLDKAAAEKI